MNAPDTRHRLAPARKPPRSKKARQSKAFIAELRRQCRLIAQADRRDTGWQQLVHLPERVSGAAILSTSRSRGPTPQSRARSL